MIEPLDDAVQPNASGLRVTCEPVIVEPGQYVWIAIADYRIPDRLPIAPVEISIRSRNSKKEIYRVVDAMQCLIDSSFAAGGYDVIASYENADTVAIAAFDVARSGFHENAARFRLALEKHANAWSCLEEGKHEEALDLLSSASRIYSSLGCPGSARQGFCDLMALALKLNRHAVAASALRDGLLHTLFESYAEASNDRDVDFDHPPELTLPLSQLTIEEWKRTEFFKASATLMKRTTNSSTDATGSPLQGVLQIVAILVEMEERHPFFLSLLATAVTESTFSIVCLRGLVKSSPSLALTSLVAIFSAAFSSEDPLESILEASLQEFSPHDLYSELTTILSVFGHEARRAFVSILQRAVPAQYIVDRDLVHVYDAQTNERLTLLPNTDPILSCILPYISSSSLADNIQLIEELTL